MFLVTTHGGGRRQSIGRQQAGYRTTNPGWPPGTIRRQVEQKCFAASSVGMTSRLYSAKRRWEAAGADK